MDYLKKKREDKKNWKSYKASVKVIRRLTDDLYHGCSLDEQLSLWKQHIDSLDVLTDKISPFKSFEYYHDDYITAYYNYLLFHYPEDERLKLHFDCDHEGILWHRKALYKEMLVRTLADIKILVHKWEFKPKSKYDAFLMEYGEYVDLSRSSFWRVCLTEKCLALSDDDLYQVIKKFEPRVLSYTKENRQWHSRVNNLLNFKID